MLRLLRLPPTYFFTVLDVVLDDILDDIFDDDFLDDGTKYFGICFYYTLKGNYVPLWSLLSGEPRFQGAFGA